MDDFNTMIPLVIEFGRPARKGSNTEFPCYNICRQVLAEQPRRGRAAALKGSLHSFPTCVLLRWSVLALDRGRALWDV
jgi:hypothetical protein